MKSIVRILAGLMMLITMNTSVNAQQSGYPDISISSLTLAPITKVKKSGFAVSENATSIGKPVASTAVPSDTLKCSITLTNSGTRTALIGKLIIVLPAEVIVLNSSFPPNTTQVNERGITGWPGYVQIDNILVAANQNETFEFMFKKSAIANKISAFVFTSLPDTNSQNNYKEASY